MNHHACRAIIFDLDGTLLDSLTDIALAMNTTLTEMGFPSHPVDAYKIMVGDGRRVLVERALPEAVRHVDGLVSRAVAGFDAQYAVRWRHNTRPYAGIEPLLDHLVERHVPLCVLSNKPHGFTLDMVHAILPRWPFHVVRGAAEGEPCKPHPGQALNMATSMGLPSSQVMFVGDTSVDMQTAHAAGMVAVGVLWGFRDEAELQAHGAHRLLRHPGELLQLLA